MKHQLEVAWKDEAFTLIGDKTEDGERITKEQAQREADRKEAEGRQRGMFDS